MAELKIKTSWAGSVAMVLLLSGCALNPRGTLEERQRMDQAGANYRVPYEQRQIPDLPPDPDWRDVLQRAFLANGDLEASYFEWKAAVARVEMASSYPNTNLSLGYMYMFSKENMKAWDRSTISASPDPMQNLQLPMKVMQAGRQKLQEAQATGFRFAAKKFDIQKNVLSAWLDYALMAEELRIQRDNVELLKMVVDTATQRVRVGGPQQDMLKAQIEYRLAENDLESMQSKLSGMRAMLNGMLARPADATLPAPTTLPSARAMPVDDARMIAAAVEANPELSALAKEVAGRRDALALAKMAYIPDINPQAAFTGGISQSIGAMVSVPLAIPMIRGQIREADAMLSAQQAMLRQTKNDRAASFVATLYALRNAERQESIFREIVLPRAQQVLSSSRQAYSAGTIGFIELIDSQRTLLEVRKLIAEVRIEREKRLVELEALAGVDMERLAGATTRPTTRPAEEGGRR